MDRLTTVASWLSLLGLPTLTALIIALWKSVSKSIKSITILHRAQKAQMRSQLLDQYAKYMAQGYIEQIYLDDWLNQYDAYHSLVGNNAVLDARKADLLRLPTTPTLSNGGTSN